METPRCGIGSLLLVMIVGASLSAQEPTVTLGGRVVDAHGEPLPVAKVWVTEVDDIGQVLGRGFTDADGVFRVPRVPLRDSWEVFACGDGWSVTRATARSAASPVLLSAQPALRLGGTLRRADGSPAVGVEVRGIAFALKPPIDEFSVTDADGRWQLTHLRAGPVSLVAAVPGEGFYACNGMQVADDDDVQLRHGPGEPRSLTVQVRDMPPEAAGKVFVELAPQNGFPGLPRPWYHAALDANGEVTLSGLPNVAYRVGLLTRDLQFVRSSVEVAPAPAPNVAPAPLVFELLPEQHVTRTLRVHLRDLHGEPVRGVRLRLGTLGTPPMRPSFATTDQRGEAAFSCMVASDTSCVVSSASPDFVVIGSPDGGLAVVGENWLRHVCPAGEALEVVVRATPAARLCGRVVDVDGAPLAGQVVGLGAAGYEQGLSATLTSAVTGPDGCFTMPVRADYDGNEEAVVTVGSGDIACCSRQFELPDSPRRFDLGDLRLPATGRLEVSLRNGAGRPVAGAVVDVSRPLANGSWVIVAMAISDVDGRACFPALQPGDRQIGAGLRVGPGPRPVSHLPIEGGKRHELQLTMP